MPAAVLNTTFELECTYCVHIGHFNSEKDVKLVQRSKHDVEHSNKL